MKKMLKKCVLLLSILSLTSCGYIRSVVLEQFADGVIEFPHEPEAPAGPTVEDKQEILDKIEDQLEPVEEPVEEPVVEPIDEINNEPIPTTYYESFNDGGNLWKPMSDTEGTVVVLLDAKHSEPFDECRIDGTKLDCRKWSDSAKKWLPTCFTNGNRQTFRHNKTCDLVTEKVVTCKLGRDTYIFTGATGVCEREE